jgi:hypothetical protein
MSRRRYAILALITLILAIYSYPTVRTALTTGSTRLPAVSAPDLGLYLSLSRLEDLPHGMVLNPYYHISVPAGGVAYLKFRSGPILFGQVNSLFRGRIWWALLVWNLFWWLLLGLSSIWLFKRFLPRHTHELALAGTAILMLFSIEGFGRSLSTWIHFLPSHALGGLPYLRPFSPQVVMPLFLCYVGFQIRALKSRSTAAWAAMVLLQFLAFTAFPFATLMMAGLTGIASLWYLATYPTGSSWRIVFGFALACALADIAFAVHGTAGLSLGFPGQGSIFRLQPSEAIKAIGKMWFLTAILVTATAATRKLPRETKWTLLGLGLSNLLFVLGDAFVSEAAFFLSDHIGYFYQPTVVILLVFLASAHIPEQGQSLPFVRCVSFAAVILCCFYGFLSADANYREWLPYNLAQADLAQWFGRHKVSADDLVITQFEGASYDACEWVPLLSQAEVLYCRNAQLSLTAEQNRRIQRFREVLYLYFDGKDRAWFQTTDGFDRYGLYGDVITFHQPVERAERLAYLRGEMIPLFDQISQREAPISDYFHRFRRVWVIQSRQNPTFPETRLSSYFDLKEQDQVGSLLIRLATPK